eukprot:CAMPEP_0178913140 /NCGR_PEP_ID=MMETSP0786-20121207/10673_1 /TAXON_ID=186022 /ORGANISM="Thalassionema frauenfeldii, Strain CCMP 1798" /LENGTH=321 /DNA_ID=CAMNT_0020585841 /DNA_START=134 /DNA_END=1096 /DNA_ORIENTATION=-
MKKRVLSIQSHVVSGYVGNKAAVFPLQLLGYDVDIINSVQFSNHTGYSQGFTGDVLNGTQLTSLVDGMEKNGLLNSIGHVLTGYIGSASFLQAVLQVLVKLRQQPNSIRFVCDPVLGDHGKLYVPEELVEIYRTQVIPVANVVTPNQFEMEKLTGIAVTTQEDALRACRCLLDMGPSLVFLTSAQLEESKGNNDDGVNDNTKTIAILAAQRSEDENQEDEFWRIDSPLFPGDFTGTGDLTASLLLGHTAASNGEVDVKSAMEKVINTVHSVIRRTHEAASTAGTTSSSNGDCCLSLELQLIAGKAEIEHPPSLFQAYRVYD